MAISLISGLFRPLKRRRTALPSEYLEEASICSSKKHASFYLESWNSYFCAFCEASSSSIVEREKTGAKSRSVKFLWHFAGRCLDGSIWTDARKKKYCCCRRRCYYCYVMPRVTFQMHFLQRRMRKTILKPISLLYNLFLTLKDRWNVVYEDITLCCMKNITPQSFFLAFVFLSSPL